PFSFLPSFPTRRSSDLFSWEMPDMPYGEKLPPACRAEADHCAKGQLHSLPHAEKVRRQHKPFCFDGPSDSTNPYGKSARGRRRRDRKSTRLNSSHLVIS